jgi:hypothetical protein
MLIFKKFQKFGILSSNCKFEKIEKKLENFANVLNHKNSRIILAEKS